MSEYRGKQGKSIEIPTCESKYNDQKFNIFIELNNNYVRNNRVQRFCNTKQNKTNFMQWLKYREEMELMTLFYNMDEPICNGPARL